MRYPRQAGAARIQIHAFSGASRFLTMNCISIFAALRDALGHLLGEDRSFTLRTYTAVGCLSGDKGARCLMTVHIGTKTNNLVLTPA